ncbi:MAG TPA: ATP-NAD kinase family protein [Candidatus Thermoplasmatota archaeon]|nr:ATP-NAD kinase family protein [Candidatus Thermoplasmatota archaeon]
MRLGLVVNPIAGLGARVGLKGTDHAVEAALARGALPEAPSRAVRFLRALAEADADVTLYVAGGAMGDDEAAEAGLSAIVTSVPGDPTDAEDTRRAVASFLGAGVDLVCFVGGDGTAADVADAIGAAELPVLGVPAGSKMYSAVFAETPERAAVVARTFDSTRPAEVLDVDEDAFRRGELRVALKGVVRVPAHKAVAAGKLAGADDDVEQHTLAEAVAAGLEPGVAHVLGAGSTMMLVKRALGVDGTLLGIDVVRDGALVVRDASEKDLLAVAPPLDIVVSPIGGQGFVLGRGNLPISAAVVRRAGAVNLRVVATPTKLFDTPALRFDTGDPALDASFPRWLRVVTGWHGTKLVRVDAAM